MRNMTSKDEMTSIEEKEDRVFREPSDCTQRSSKYAVAALSHYNNEMGLNLDLVKPGLIGYRFCGASGLFHINFKAKCSDIPDDPVQTFFAQVRQPKRDLVHMSDEIIIDICMPLGLSHELPREAYIGGCTFCDNYIRHPIGGAKFLLNGCESDDDSWLHVARSPQDCQG